MTEKASPLRERALHVPGQSLDETINRLWDDRGLAYFTYAMGFFGIAIWEWLRWFRPSVTAPWLTTAIAMLVVAYSVRGLLRIRRQTDQLKLGRDGERAVAEVLDGLKASGCVVFHDIVGNGFNVDHVVLGPGGIFAIETKTVRKSRDGSRQEIVRLDRGRITAGGAELGSAPLEQAGMSANSIRELLKESTGKTFPVKPCVVFPDWFVEEAPREGWVLNPKRLAGFIRNEPRCMTNEELHMAAFHLSAYIRSPWACEDKGLAKKILGWRQRPHVHAGAAH